MAACGGDSGGGDSGGGAGAGDATAVLLTDLQRQLDDLMLVHDHHFPADRDAKQALLRARAAAICSAAAAAEAGEAALAPATRAQLAYITGKALDSGQEFNSDAEARLERAVKLAPQPAYWTALAHAKFKKRDYAAARGCLDAALKGGPHGPALLLYSMLLRQLTGPGVDVAANVADSVERARAAVALDVKDAAAWCMLGNAQLSLFFAASHDPADLDKARKAYARAAALEAAPPTTAGGAAATGGGGSSDAPPVDRRLPDLHYNRGIVCLFQEDYAAAVESLTLAKALDPSLEPAASLEAAHDHVRRVADLLARHGGLKGKRAKDAAASVAGAAGDAWLATASDAVRGTFAGKRRVAVTDLHAGTNAGVYIVLAPVAPVARGGNPPACFIGMDASGACAAVSVFHLSEDATARIVDRSVVAIAEPVVKPVALGGAAYAAVQVLHPDTLVADGRALRSTFARPEMRVTAFDS